MNFTKLFILSELTNQTTGEDKIKMQEAVSKNTFFVVAIPLMGHGFSIGAMGDDLPCLMATEAEARADNDEMVSEYLQQIQEGERDDDDEWEGDVMIASIQSDNQIALYTLDDKAMTSPIWMGDMKEAAGL